MSVLVRPVRASDFAGVSEIAYATGFFGASASRYFPDAALFGDLWVRPYFVGPPTGFVAEDDGRLLGYIIGTVSWTTYRRAFARVLAGVLWRVIRGGYARPAGALPFLLRQVRCSTPHAPEAAFPAHLHLNLVEDARGLGLGSALLQAYLELLMDRGVPGVQLSTTLENRAAVAVYRRFGLTVWATWESPLWVPWLGRPAMHVIMTRTLAPSGTEDQGP